MDAVWLTEHHFDGAVAYADPVVFGAAVAMRTRRVKIGFAVVEMALHHPVRLAAQTALLDNLSHGRLIMGTGRGSAYNEYEYFGFGLTLEEGREMLPEAEELLVKAWTGEDVDHQGRFWNSRFPHPASPSLPAAAPAAGAGLHFGGIDGGDGPHWASGVDGDTPGGHAAAPAGGLPEKRCSERGFRRRLWRTRLTRPGGSAAFTWLSRTMRRGRWPRERCGVSALTCWMLASSTTRAAFRPGTGPAPGSGGDGGTRFPCRHAGDGGGGNQGTGGHRAAEPAAESQRGADPAGAGGEVDAALRGKGAAAGEVGPEQSQDRGLE